MVSVRFVLRGPSPIDFVPKTLVKEIQAGACKVSRDHQAKDRVPGMRDEKKILTYPAASGNGHCRAPGNSAKL
jgi:hypothetical protein